MKFTIAKRLTSGFSVAIIVIATLLSYSLYNLKLLDGYQQDGAKRANDAIMATEVAGTVPAMYQIIADAIINRDLKTTSADWAEIKKEMDGDVINIANTVDTREEQKMNDDAMAAYKKFVALFENEMFPILRTADLTDPRIKALDGRIDALMVIMTENYKGIRDSIISEAAEADALFDSTSITTFRMSAIFAIIAGVILVLITVFTTRSIVNPIRALAAYMVKLAEGDNSEEVPATERQDEIGEMATTVQVFKENAIERIRLEEESAEREKKELAAEQKRAEDEAEREQKTRKDEERQRKQAEAERKKMLLDMADDFESSVGGVVQAVTSASTQVHTSAESMAANAEETDRQSAAVAAAAEQASTNVQTVASAAEELSGSISEISRQVSKSSDISSSAVVQADKTSEQIQNLAKAAEKIGNVVDLINDVASQTDLLALNATIEAARAGDAGKGFAVVALEVGNLAKQTSNATEEISAQIGAIQSATKDSVAAIGGISETINQINEIASSIASAVEEQGAATQEIARNVEQAATGTQEVTSNITGVTQAASETGTAATQMLDSANELTQQSEILRSEVDTFLKQIRTDNGHGSEHGREVAEIESAEAPETKTMIAAE